MNPMRVSMLRMKGCLRLIQTWRASATSGRFCSTARRSFFVCQIEPAQATPDRDTVRFDPLPLAQLGHQFIKGQVTLFRDPALDPTHHAGQLAMPAPVALRLGFKRTCLALQQDHVVDELDRNAESSRRSPMRVTLFNKINDASPKFNRKWFTHHQSPISATHRGNHTSSLMGILNQNGSNPL